MLTWTPRLSAGFPFVRVDLYAVDGRIVFGRMTWQPSAGSGTFNCGERVPFPTPGPVA
jgi:hypothetical protein